MKFYRIIIFIMIVCGTLGIAKPRVTLNKNTLSYGPKDNADFTQKYLFLNPNNIRSIFWNSGVFNQDPRTTNTAGFEWPKGSGHTACFTSGLCIGCYITDASGVPQLAECMASYKGEFVNGAVKYIGTTPTYDSDTKFRMYSVKAGDNSGNNPDYDGWTSMIPYGAPYEDVNHNGQYDPGIDIPGQKNASQTIFQVLTDADSSNRASGEGFGGGITKPLLFAEIHFTAWAYTTPGLEDLEFVNWVVINKGLYSWDSTFTGVVVDPDLGNANDDYIGCDTVDKINLGFCYNGDNEDEQYGVAPPAFGMDYFKSPIIKTPGQTYGDTLGLTSFTFFTNNSSSPPACESDPNGEPYPAYLNLRGLKKDGSPFLDPTTTPATQTKYCYPGDPETNLGWTEQKGCIQNCGGITGTQIAPNPTGDRRFIFASGRTNFKFNPSDTQNIVLAQFVARGSNNLNSVTKLKNVAKTAKIIYLSDFKVTPTPPQPVVTASYTQLLNGTCNINLTWGDVSESYRYWDSIFFAGSDSNIYEFQGYEVYEINKFYTSSLPEFNKPESMDLQALQLVDQFDIIDGYGQLIDTFATGVSVGGVEQYGVYSIVPPYKMNPGPSFPEKGISRGITITKTRYAENYGGNSSLIYGQEYQFAVIAYGISKSNHLRKGFRVIRNSVSSCLIKVVPTMPPAGTYYTFKDGDTLNTSSRDLGFIPIIRNQDKMLNATYRAVFNADTTYNILRKITGASVFDTVYKNININNGTSSSSDMTAKTVDGVLMKMSKIKYTATNSAIQKIGVIKNIGSLASDSSQTRYEGWEYTPSSHKFFKGSSLRMPTGDPWQNVEMSLSFPCPGTYISRSSSVKAVDLKKVKLVFSNTNTSYAYRYQNSGGATIVYKNMVSVPFKAYEMEFADSTPYPVQLNIGIVDTGQGGWYPSADSLGGKLHIVIFSSPYDTNITSYKVSGGSPLNYWVKFSTLDISYIWAPRLLAPGRTFVENDEFWIYPYTICVPFREGPNYPLYYEFSTTAPVFGDPNLAKNSGAMDKIKVVPNPYYGFSTLDRSTSDKFVTFRNLPINCTIKIYSLNGDLIRTLEKKGTGTTSTSSTLEWNLQNLEKVPVASGIYIALIDAPGIGTKIIKLAIFTAQERINF